MLLWALPDRALLERGPPDFLIAEVKRLRRLERRARRAADEAGGSL
eukprot:gene3192-51835_t